MEVKIGINNSVVSESDKSLALSENGNACQFCGFTADKFQEVVHYKDKNLVSCSFCAQTLNLFSCAERRAGYLIYLPEMTQVELNHILRAIYVARTDVNPKVADKARRAFDALTSRRKLASEIIGTDDPKILADIMDSFMNDKEKKDMPTKLKGIKVLSLDKKIAVEDGMEFNEFPQMLNYWKSNVDFLNKPCSNWEKLERVVGAKKVEEAINSVAEQDAESVPELSDDKSESQITDEVENIEFKNSDDKEGVDG